MIGMILGELLKKKGIQQKALSESTGISEDTISKIITGKTKKPHPETIDKIASFLNVDREIFFTDRRTEPREDFPPFKRIPVLNWVQAGQFTEWTDMDYPPGDADEFIELPVRGDRIFALRVRGDSMEPEFLEGEIIVIDPELEVQHGDYAILKIIESGETTLKRVEYYENVVVLRPLNPKYRPIEIKNGRDQVKIVGKVVRKTKEY